MVRRNKPVDYKALAKTVQPRAQAKKEEQSARVLPSGITMLNLALADNATAGLPMGKIINIVGDSGVGKTMIAETCLATIANNPQFDDYDLYLDDAEHALEIDMDYLFGKKAANRIKAVRYGADGLPINSDTIEQFFANILDLLKKGKPFVYFLDSLDALTDSSEYEQAETLRKNMAKADAEDMDGVAMPGSYGMVKAKLMSQVLRTIKAELAGLRSTVVIISQVRDNINAMFGQSKKRRAGGKALEFYCTHVIWLSAVSTIKTEVKAGSKKAYEVIGSSVEAKVTKNKLTGKKGKTISFDIYYDYGADDTTSIVNFLCEQDVLIKKGAYIDASVLGYTEKMFLVDLVDAIENDNKQNDIVALAQKAWNEKEDALKLKRKPRFE